MHGIGGSAADWSNNKIEFAFNEDSLIEFLRANYDVDIYYLQSSYDKDNGNYSFGFNLLEKDNYKKSLDKVKINPEMIKKHMVFVYESSNSLDSIDFLYKEINYVIDSLYLNLKDLGINHPLVNLIGYDLGGLLNIMYANNHPHNVAKIFNFSTPYRGSNIANISKLNDKLQYVYSNFYQSSAKEEVQALLDKKHLNSIEEGWNNALLINPTIEVHNLVGATGINFIDEVVLEELKGLLKKASAVVTKIYADKVDERNGATLDMVDLIIENQYILSLITGEKSDSFSMLVEMFLPIYRYRNFGIEPTDDELSPINKLITNKKDEILKNTLLSKHLLSGNINLNADQIISIMNLIDPNIIIKDIAESQVTKKYPTLTDKEWRDAVKEEQELIKKQLKSTISNIESTIKTIKGIVKVVKAIPITTDILSDVAYLAGSIASIYNEEFMGLKYDEILPIIDEITVNIYTQWGKDLSFFNKITKRQLVFLNDFFLGTDSQKGYDGMKEYAILVEPSDYVGNVSNLNSPLKSVHNVATYISRFYTYIGNNINLGRQESSAFMVQSLDKNEVKILGWNDYYDISDVIEIPQTIYGKTVTQIGDEAFRNLDFTKLILPSTIKFIGNNAFADNKSLTTIEFSNGLEAIGKQAFLNCENLGQLNLPETLLSIDADSFACCNNVKFYISEGNE